MNNAPLAAALTALLSQTQALRLTRLQIAYEVQKSGPLPPWLGSALRGSFGHAYKRVVCMVSHGECERCLLRQRCPYTYLFETWRPEKATWMTKYDRVPHPFILHAPPTGTARVWEAGESLPFEMTLFGQAVELLPYLILSWEQMATAGLGSSRLPLKLQTVKTCPLPQGEPQVIYTPGQDLRGDASSWSQPLSALAAPPFHNRPALTLHWLTPVRLSNAHPDQAPGLAFQALISSLLRRLSMLAYFHGGIQPEVDFQTLTTAAASVQALENSLYWQDLHRYSSRQKKAMNLGGFSGSITYEAAAQDFLPLLWPGQWLHAGKNTSFGLGQYRLAGGLG